MRLPTMILAASLLLISGATAQSVPTALGDAAARYVQSCASSLPQLNAAHVPCACSAGVLSGAMSDGEYLVMGALVPFVNNGDAMNNAVANLIAGGVEVATIQQTANALMSSADRINAVCSVFEQSQWLMVSAPHLTEKGRARLVKADGRPGASASFASGIGDMIRLKTPQ